MQLVVLCSHVMVKLDPLAAPCLSRTAELGAGGKYPKTRNTAPKVSGQDGTDLFVDRASSSKGKCERSRKNDDTHNDAQRPIEKNERPRRKKGELLVYNYFLPDIKMSIVIHNIKSNVRNSFYTMSLSKPHMIPCVPFR
mmetsp:Transcript_3092/g.6911  ORF Transcript_3092/g.6911 Transcript_3092/m.6911 type:complete len:139 (+) Transcript_3092:1464-1880(+)